MTSLVAPTDPRLETYRDKDQFWVALDDAATKNALDHQLTRTLAHIVENVEEPILVISGKSGAFSSGTSLTALMTMSSHVEDSPYEVESAVRDGGNLIEDIVFSHSTAVGVVDGVCTGAGIGICLACDYRVATSRSRFTTGYGKLGLPSDFGTYDLLKLRVGKKQAQALMKDSSTLSAKQALKMGLIDAIVTDTDRKSVKKFLKKVDSRDLRSEVPEDFSARLDQEAQNFVSALRDPKTRSRIEKALRKAVRD